MKDPFFKRGNIPETKLRFIPISKTISSCYEEELFTCSLTSSYNNMENKSYTALKHNLTIVLVTIHSNIENNILFSSCANTSILASIQSSISSFVGCHNISPIQTNRSRQWNHLLVASPLSCDLVPA